MNRDEAIEKAYKISDMHLEDTLLKELIDKIFDDFEKEDTRYGCPMSECKYFEDGQIIGECLNCCRNYYDMFEEKK